MTNDNNSFQSPTICVIFVFGVFYLQLSLCKPVIKSRNSVILIQPINFLYIVDSITFNHLLQSKSSLHHNLSIHFQSIKSVPLPATYGTTYFCIGTLSLSVSRFQNETVHTVFLIHITTSHTNFHLPFFLLLLLHFPL